MAGERAWESRSIDAIAAADLKQLDQLERVLIKVEQIEGGGAKEGAS